MKQTLFFFAFCLGLALVFLRSFDPAHAQTDDTLPINYDAPISGTLDNRTYRRLYSFEGRAGEIVTLEMNALEGDLDPYLSLLDGGGRGLAFSDDDGAGFNARIDNFRLPSSGSFFIVATRYGHGLGSSSGVYELRLSRLGVTTSSGDLIRYGDPNIIGLISNQQPQSVYVFIGQRGDVINLRMRRTSGNLDPLLDLANAQGQILITVDDDPTAIGTLDAGIINYTLPYGGYYLIVATRYGRQSGLTNGSYLLTLDAIPEAQRGFSAKDALLIDYGLRRVSRLDETMPERYFRFEGRRGDVITATLERVSGNLNPTLRLLDLNQVELQRSAETEPNQRARLQFPLPADGDYFLIVARAGGSEGATAGDYELRLSGRRSIIGAEAVEIFYGSEVSGYINDTLPYEEYLFFGEEGDIITLGLSATSENLVPLLTLYQDDKQITFSRPDSNSNTSRALIQNFRITETAIYRVEVSRMGREGGATSGGYLLRLDGR